MIDFLRVFKAAPVPLLVFDPDDFRILAASDAALAVTGAAREDLVGKLFDEAFPVDPDDSQSFENVRQRLAVLKQVRETGEAVVVPVQRYAIRRRGGQTERFEERYWTLSDSPVHDASGKLLYILHRADDVTDVVRFEENEQRDNPLRQAHGSWLAAEVLRHAEELRAQNEHLRAAQRVANVGSWRIRAKDQARAWSDEMYRITGIPRDAELSNATLNEIIHPDDRAEFNEKRQQLLEGKLFLVEFEHRIVRVDNGEVRWVRERIEITRDEHNRPAWVYGTLQDITEYHRAEVKVRESEERFRLVAKATADTIWDWNKETDITWWNEGFEEIFGYTPEELGNDTEDYFSRIHPDDRRRVAALVQAVIDGVWDEWSDEYRYRRADGTYANVAVRGYVVERDEEGKATRVVGGMNDVSNAKEREARLQEQAALLDKAQDAIIVSDTNFTVTFWNKGAERVYGWTAEEVLGKNKRELLEKQLDKFDAGVQQVLQGREWIGTLEQQRKDGSLLTVEAAMSLVTDAAGKPARILCINTDITERLALEDQLRQSQRLEAVGQLTGGIAHDFNNLLTVILGNAEFMVEQQLDEAQLKKLATMMRDAALRGSELTHGLLAFARRQPLEPKTVDVNALVKQMNTLLRRTLPETIDLKFVGKPDLWKAYIDPAQLESVVLNLAINSKDAMPRGGKLTIETGNAWLDEEYASRNADAAPGRYVLLAVTDTGTGISADVIGKVFDPFFTTKAQGKGTGLGLSMAYGFARQSGGHIRIYSEPGDGTTVKVYLPRAAQQGDVEEARPAETGRRGVGETVLVVEDDELVRMHAESQLEEFGYKVLSANSGPEALDIIEKEPGIDLLFTDVVMSGGMNGPELVEVARRIRPKLKVLYTSGYTENAVIHHGRLDEGVLLLQKPYRRNELAKKVQDALRESER